MQVKLTFWIRKGHAKMHSRYDAVRVQTMGQLHRVSTFIQWWEHTEYVQNRRRKDEERRLSKVASWANPAEDRCMSHVVAQARSRHIPPAKTERKIGRVAAAQTAFAIRVQKTLR